MATPDERAAALAVYLRDGAAAAARHAGVTPRTIYTWADKAGISRELPKSLEPGDRWENQAARHASRIGRVARLALDQLEAKLPDASPKETAVILGILVDKAQLLSGGATARTENVEKSELDRSIERLVDAHANA